MIVYGYSLLDVKAGLFSPPFFLIHDSLAIRAVCELALDKTTTPGKYPGDFVLYRVGAFDDGAGVFIADGRPDNLGVVSALMVALENGR